MKNLALYLFTETVTDIQNNYGKIFIIARVANIHHCQISQYL